jgi:hypothetical protein
LLYKSFALVVPAGLGLAGWYLRSRDNRLGVFLARDSWKVLITLSVSLALFSAWFLLDPDPGAVWREFVLGENLGKFDKPGGYLPRLLWGPSSVWALALGYPLNAGLLFFPVVALFVLAWRRREELSGDERGLWIWVLTFLFVYAVPSQRSSRYLLPAMPALAVLLALGWRRIPRWVLALSLLASGVVVAGIATLSFRLQQSLPGPPLYPTPYWALLAGVGTVVLAALVVPALTRPLLHTALFLCTLSFAAFFRPFDASLGRYDGEARQRARGREVWVPADFIAKEEGYRFLLPGARVRAYREDRDTRATELLARYPLVVIRQPLQDGGAGVGRVLGERLDLRGRQTVHEILEILRGHVVEHLFVREQLVEARASAASPR